MEETLKIGFLLIFLSVLPFPACNFVPSILDFIGSIQGMKYPLLERDLQAFIFILVQK